MKYKIEFPLKRATDKWSLTGKYYLIDGELIIEMGSRDEMGMHKDLFEKIKRMKPEYKDYHYLYFPRGVVMFDETSKVSYISGPDDLDQSQVYRIGRSFEAFKLKWESDEHYNWPYIELDITLSGQAADHDDEIIAEEIKFVKEHFDKQIQMYKGTSKATFI